jgi:hypothetical protein
MPVPVAKAVLSDPTAGVRVGAVRVGQILAEEPKRLHKRTREKK